MKLEDKRLLGIEESKVRKEFLEIENDAKEEKTLILKKGDFELFDILLKQRTQPSSSIDINYDKSEKEKAFRDMYWGADLLMGCVPFNRSSMSNRMMVEKHIERYPDLKKIIMRIFDEIESFSFVPIDKSVPSDDTSDLFLRRSDFNNLKYAWSYPDRNPIEFKENKMARLNKD